MDLAPEFATKWRGIERNTNRIDRDACLALLPAVYKLLELDYPGADAVHFVASPDAALRLINEVTGTKDTWYEPFISSYETEFFAQQDETRNAKIQPLLNYAAVSGWTWIGNRAVVVCDRPVEIVTRPGVNPLGQDDVFGRDGAPCILYADGWGVYAINNTLMPKDIVLTAPEKLDANLLSTLTNAQQRAEFIKKITVQRLAEQLGWDVLDSSGGYELINIRLPDGRKRPFLKMNNPSVQGMIHIEGVPPEITTVAAANAWRMGEDKFTAPQALT